MLLFWLVDHFFDVLFIHFFWILVLTCWINMQFLLTVTTMHDIQAWNLLYAMSWDLNDWVKLRRAQPSFLDFYSLNMKIIDGWKFLNVQVHFFQDCWKIKTCSIKTKHHVSQCHSCWNQSMLCYIQVCTWCKFSCL